MKVTAMCLPENENREAFSEGFKGVIGCGNKKKALFGVNCPKQGVIQCEFGQM